MTVLGLILAFTIGASLGAVTLGLFAARSYDKGWDDGWRKGYLRGVKDMERSTNSALDKALVSVARLKGILFPVPPSDEVAEAEGEEAA